MKTKNFFRYETFVIIGIIMTLSVGIKLVGIVNFSSDWFWLIAGIGFIVEGAISLIKQKAFDNKYKIVLRKSSK